MMNSIFRIYKMVMSIFIICFFVTFFLGDAYALESAAHINETISAPETETIDGWERETVTEQETETAEVRETETTEEKKAVTPEVVREVLGKDYWILSGEQIEVLNNAGYDVSGFCQDTSNLNAGIMTLGVPEDYSGEKLPNKGYLSWSTAVEDKIYMFGGNSYWRNGTYVEIYNHYRKGIYDGEQRDAYCLNPYTGAPAQGNVDVYTIENDDLLKVMYYGYNGPGYSAEIEKIYGQVDPYYSAFYNGKADAYYILTHCWAALVYGDANWAYGLSQSAADTVIALQNHVKKLPSPNTTSGIRFNQSEGTDTFLNADGLYQSHMIYVEGSPKDYITFEIPESINLHLTSGSVYTGKQSIKLYGGTKFYLTASEAAVNGTFEGKYPSSVFTYRNIVAFGVQDVSWLNQYYKEGAEAYLKIEWPEDQPVVREDLKITLTKIINADDINFDNGNPMFTFKVTGEDVYGNRHTYYQIIDFTEEYVKKNVDVEGKVHMSAVFEELTEGTYTAWELDTSRYRLAAVSNIVNGILSGDKVDFDLTGPQAFEGKADFLNDNYEQRNFSDAQKVINKLTK